MATTEPSQLDIGFFEILAIKTKGLQARIWTIPLKSPNNFQDVVEEIDGLYLKISKSIFRVRIRYDKL
jgi:hypothetical protein